MPQKRTGNKSLLLSTRVYNEIADAAEWVKFHGRKFGGNSKPGETTHAWIWALNKTGVNLLAGDLVGIGQPTVLPAANAVSFQHQVAHEVVLPNAVTHATRFAVCLTACPNNTFFQAMTSGVASVQIDVQAGHIGTWAARAKLVTGTVGNLISDPVGSIVVLWCASATAGNTAPTTAGVQKARILVPGQVAAAAASLPRYGRLSADLAHNGTATVSLLEGSVGSETLPGSPQTVTGHNLLYRQLWTGAEVSLVPHDVTGGDPSIYRITWSNSASRIRGTTAAAIAAGGSGTLNTIIGIDGEFPAATATAHNVLVNYGVASGVKAWAEWCQVNNRWEIYSADCAP